MDAASLGVLHTTANGLNAADPAAARAGQFRQYLLYAGLPNLLGAAGLFLLYALYGHYLLFVFGIGTLVNGALYGIAYRRVATHGVQRSAPIICLGMWGLCLLGAATESRALPIVILMSLLPVIAVVPYVSHRVLLRLCLVSISVIFLYAFLVAMQWSPTLVANVPDQDWYLLIHWGVVVCVAVAGLSLWHTSRIFNGAVADLAQGNRALAASEKALEQRVAERSAELTRSRAEILARRDAALGSSRHKADFLANMSHELRTPLNAILGFSEALESQMFGALEARQLEYVRDIRLSGQQLLNLINTILDEAKIEAGKYVLRPRCVVLAELIASAAREFESRHPGRRAEPAELPPEAGATLDGDGTALRVALRNLLEEAGQAVVPLSLARRDQQLCFRVGAPEPATQVEAARASGDADRKREIEARPAFALSRKLIELHGGTLVVHLAADGARGFEARLPTGGASA